MIDTILYKTLLELGCDKSTRGYYKLLLLSKNLILLDGEPLLAHIVKYIQIFNVESLWEYKNFDKDFRTELEDILKKHGCDSFDELKKVVVDQNIHESLTGKNVGYKLMDPVAQGTNLHMSTNYDQFDTFAFNRKTSTAHVNDLIRSIRLWENCTVLCIILTSCITGIEGLYIADGQHRFLSLKALGKSILYFLKRMEDPYEIVRFIAHLNVTSKPWGNVDYLHAWKEMKLTEYVYLNTKVEDTKFSIPLMVSMCTYGQKLRDPMNEFKEGSMKIEDRQYVESRIQYLSEIIRLIGQNRSIGNELFESIVKHPSYHHETFIAELKSQVTEIKRLEDPVLIVSKMTQFQGAGIAA